MSRIERFSFPERTAHWISALSFLYAALTGLSLWSHHLYWLSSVFGGGEAVRRWHPWGGIVFAVALGVMFRNWAHDMKLDRDDREWLKGAHKYAVLDDEGLPEPGRFNAGQKMLFWVQCVATFALLATGVVLWWPELMPRGLRLAAIVLHPSVAIVSLGGIIVHIYMGTVAVPGAFRSMVRGWVSSDWASAHHPKWFRQIKKS